MFTKHEIENFLFLDIETASGVAQHDDLPERMQALWGKKMRWRIEQEPELTEEDLFADRAGLYAEFGRIVCISCGYVRFEEGHARFNVKSFFGEDERKILEDFATLIQRFSSKDGRNLCAHNGKDFDFPYISRRMLIHGIEIPSILQTQGKKPWEVNLVDSMHLWQFGQYRYPTSLDLLAAVLEIPSPKGDIDGSEVSQVYWEERNYDRIRLYCERDVQTTAQVLLRLSLLPLIPMESEAG